MNYRKPRFRPFFQTLETRRCFAAALGMDFEAPPEDAIEEIAIIAVNGEETSDVPSADPVATGRDTQNLFAIDPVFRGGVSVSASNMNDDSNDIVIIGTGLAGGGHVRVIDAVSPSQQSGIFAFDPSFTGGVFVAAGDVDGDGSDDIITSPDLGGGPHVRVIDATLPIQPSSLFTFDPTITGRGFATGGNSDDIIISSGPGGGPHVRVFDATPPSQPSSFSAFDPTFTGGVFVAAGDVNGDGNDDIITSPGLGGGSHVRVFSGRANDPLTSFFAFGSGFSGGVRVAAGDTNDDSSVEIITSPGAGGGPHLQISNGADGNQFAQFISPYGGFSGGVRVATGDVNGDGTVDIITAAGPHVRVFDGVAGAEFTKTVTHDQAFSGGLFITAGDVDLNGNGFAEIITVPGTTGGPHVRVFDGVTGTPLPADSVDSIFEDLGRG